MNLALEIPIRSRAWHVPQDCRTAGWRRATHGRGHEHTSCAGAKSNNLRFVHSVVRYFFRFTTFSNVVKITHFTLFVEPNLIISICGCISRVGNCFSCSKTRADSALKIIWSPTQKQLQRCMYDVSESRPCGSNDGQTPLCSRKSPRHSWRHPDHSWGRGQVVSLPLCSHLLKRGSDTEPYILARSASHAEIEDIRSRVGEQFRLEWTWYCSIVFFFYPYQWRSGVSHKRPSLFGDATIIHIVISSMYRRTLRFMMHTLSTLSDWELGIICSRHQRKSERAERKWDMFRPHIPIIFRFIF